FRNGFEEDVEQNLLIDQDQRIQFMRKRKDQMEIPDGKKFGLLGLQPLFGSRRPTFRTMPVAARVETGTFKTTRIALLKMTAQGFGPAHFNRVHDFAVSGRQKITAPVVVSVKLEDIGDFPSGASISLRPLGRGLHR